MANDRNDALKDYVEVNVRIDRFWAKFPNGRIETEVLKWEEGVITMKAKVFTDKADTLPAATGHAYEKEGSSYINKTSALENCETSCVGRALAILGFEIKKSVASKEEVANAMHQQATAAEPPKKADKPTFPDADSTFPTEAQIKMIGAKLGASGYLKGDMPLIGKVVNDVLGYEIKALSDIKRADINRLAEFLTSHKKEVKA